MVDDERWCTKEKIGVPRLEVAKAFAVWHTKRDDEIERVIIAGNANIIVLPCAGFWGNCHDKIAAIHDVRESIDLGVIEIDADRKSVDVRKIATNIGIGWEKFKGCWGESATRYDVTWFIEPFQKATNHEGCRKVVDRRRGIQHDDRTFRAFECLRELLVERQGHAGGEGGEG